MLYARYVKGLTYEEVRVLKAMYSMLRDYNVMQVEQIVYKARMHIDRVNFALARLNEKKFIVKDENGYRLVYSGLDALVLWELASKDIVVGVGKPIGIGKEADVLECIDSNANRLALKLFRIGRISFRDVARKRSYRIDEHAHNWLLLSVEAARREYNALNKLRAFNVNVPKVLAYNKHAIVMEYIEGIRLIDCNILHNPKEVLSNILYNIKIAYCNAKLVSGDLSEYNILYDGNNIWIIDWPQCVCREHPSADLLLERDLINIINFFRKRYGLDYDIKKALEYIKSCNG
jgi:RIO kinase 2